ncbi:MULTISPECIES: CBS domain-containing protein [unclassified Romboutsia]|uniref:CBS domain-containing protein n=1 Tax=unclassified Romboutsia TaxID=2626894 RepID=UPI0008234A1E|nr:MULTISPECIES: CBS domain-containing protein [unclassified Romboutsia]SCI36800.1 Hypoxic response protein 1 [uncultured Clostridium sp.]
MNNKKAKDIMTTDVIVAKKGDTISKVANILISGKIGGMPVVDDDNKVIGVISETDIIKKEKKAHSTPFINVLEGIIFLDNFNKMEKDLKEISAYKVEDLMSTNIITVNEDDTFDNIANLMINKSINRVPVVDKENKLKGIICRYDIIRAMYNE